MTTDVEGSRSDHGRAYHHPSFPSCRDPAASVSPVSPVDRDDRVCLDDLGGHPSHQDDQAARPNRPNDLAYGGYDWGWNFGGAG
nr:hypothetical protein [uncultured Rhizobium sp.]